MKSMYKYISVVALLSIGVSCTDDSLDPLNMSSVQKGTILALRGTALTNLYTKGKPVAEFFPKIATGSEKFVYETEYLAEDVSTLASVDLYVLKNLGGGVTERKLIKTIDGSTFAKGNYPNPSATIEIKVTEIFPLLGIATTFPMSSTAITNMLDTYKFGINLESDINLKDGSKILAADIIAAGLFQSNQFYPSMRLNWAVTDYCSYAADWSADYDATELSENTGAYGPYTVTFTQDASNPNKFTTDNFYDSGWPLSMILTPSVDVASQTLKVPADSVTTGSGNKYKWSGSGTYNQCLHTAAINMVVTKNGASFDVLVWKLVKK